MAGREEVGMGGGGPSLKGNGTSLGTAERKNKEHFSL